MDINEIDAHIAEISKAIRDAVQVSTPQSKPHKGRSIYTTHRLAKLKESKSNILTLLHRYQQKNGCPETLRMLKNTLKNINKKIIYFHKF